jgi:hypothetical protein
MHGVLLSDRAPLVALLRTESDVAELVVALRDIAEFVVDKLAER